jgi:choice-of-anchor B domain-containing protein
MLSRQSVPPIRAILGLGTVAALAAAVCPALARDPDFQKLKDRVPPFRGPVVAGPAAQSLLRAPSGGTRSTFDSRHVQLLSWMPLNTFPGTNNTGADCWGYTSPNGREYALMGMQRGTAFVEITNPSSPQIRGFINGPGPSNYDLWHDVTVIGQYAYAVSEAGLGIQVIDLSQIDNGVVTLVQNRMQGGHTTTHTILSNPDTGFLYLCGANIGNGGLIPVATQPTPAHPSASPTNPTIEGSGWTTQYVHEAQIVNYTSGPYAGHEIAFCFAAGPYYGYSTGFAIVDVTDKSNLITLCNITYPANRFCHQGWLTPDKHYLYIDDELDGLAQGVVPNLTRVLDVSDLAHPFVASTFNGPATTAIDHNLYVRGRYLYEGNYTSGLRVFDGADPLHPFEIAYIDTHPENNATTYNGVWGNYPFFASHTVIISDIERGLFIVKVDCPSDFDADGQVNITDFLAYLAAYAAGDTRSDVNNDGTINLADFLAFLSYYASECP